MLPNWNGAAVCYMRARAMLGHLAAAGHVKRVRRGRQWQCEVSPDMLAIIDAMNSGNEEQLKGLLMEREQFAVVDHIRL